MPQRSHTRRFRTLSGLIALVVFCGVLLVQQPANALLSPAAVQIVTDPQLAAQQAAQQAKSDIKDKIAQTLSRAAKVAFKNSLRVFLSRLTEDTANFIATKGTGQTPLFYTKQGYLKDVMNSAGGAFLDSLSRDIIGKSICQPLSLTAQVNLEAALQGLVAPTDLCRKNCNTLAATALEQELTPIQGALVAAQNKQSTGTSTMECQVIKTLDFDAGDVGPLAPDNVEYNGKAYQFSPFITLDSGTPDPSTYTPLPPRDCVQILSKIQGVIRSEITSNQNICVQKCAAHLQNAPCQATDAWRNVRDADELSLQVGLFLKPENNDVGQLLLLADQFYQQQVAKSEDEKFQASISGGFKGVTNPVSGETTVPAALVGERARIALQESTTAERTFTDDLKADAIYLGNSLVKRLIKSWFIDKCGLNPLSCKGPTSASSAIGKLYFLSGDLSAVAAAQLQYAQIGRVDYITGNASSNAIAVTDTLAQQGLINAGFKQAIDEQLTVQEAIDKGLLDPSKTFAVDSQGNSPRDGYSLRMMQSLRVARVLPVGWELAARFLQQNIGSVQPKSLGDLVASYDLCGQTSFCSNSKTATCTSDADCTIFGPDGTCTSGKASPFCGLVDPGWVLKAPQTYCRRQGAGEEVLARNFVCDEDSNGDGRVNCSPDPVSGGDEGAWVVERNTDVCADDVSCVVENPDGTCLAYGNCFEERPTFKFDGDACQPTEVSCQAYQSPTGQTVAYLDRTVETNGCNADNAGCQWFCREPSFSTATNRWTCTADPGTAGGTKISFDRDVPSCPASAAGCTEFIRTVPGTNLIANPSFERYDGIPNDTGADTFLGWTAVGTSTFAVSSDNASVGTANLTALQLPAGGGRIEATFDTAAPLSDRVFTLSYYAKAIGGACDGQVNLASTDGVYSPLAATKSYGPTWNRYSQTFLLPTASYSQNAVRATLSAGICELAFDNVQLEASSGASTWHDYGSVNTVNLNGTRASCDAADVGCDRWTPVVGGGAAVPGIANALDQCGADQVGCRTYRKMPITSVPERAGDDVTIIAATGKQCSAAFVGCEEYTNLDRAAEGGESREYYSSIRQCVKPDASGVSTFYSWVGDDLHGFQLRAQRYLQAINGAPCTNVSVPTVGGAPTCEDGVSKIARTCTPDDITTNPDCGEFYDASAQVYYILRSKVIVATDECHPYRNTIDQELGLDTIYYLQASGSISCPASANKCREFKGSTGNNVEIVLSDTFRGDTSAWIGGTKSSESLTAGDTSLRVEPRAEQTIGLAVHQNGSYLVRVWAKPQSGTGALTFGFTDGTVVKEAVPISMTADWNYYQLGPVLLDTTVSSNERFYIREIGGAPIFIDNLVLQNVRDSAFLIDGTARTCEEVNCELYKNRAGTTLPLKSFSRLCQSSAVGCESLIDTKNSTSPFAETFRGVDTPADQTVTLVNDPSKACKDAEVGCTRFGQPTLDPHDVVAGFRDVYLIDDPDQYTTSLCLASENRCQEFTNEETSAKTYFKDPGTKTCEYRKAVSVGGKLIDGWFVTGTNELCVTESLVCSAPGTAQHGKVASGTLQQQACRVAGGNLTAFPRNGQVGMVDIRCLADDGSIGGSCSSDFAGCLASGGRCIAIPDFGLPARLCEGGADAGAACNVDTDCADGGTCSSNWTGLCSAAASGCNEYRDPIDPSGCNAACTLDLDNSANPISLKNDCTLGDPVTDVPGCRPHFYIRQSIDASSQECNNSIDADRGCLPFYDSSLRSADLRT